MRFAYDLSIIVPGIRKQNWIQLYEETAKACRKFSFEFILVGPYPPPEELLQKHNLKYIKDFGTPTRSFQMGTLVSEGRFLTWLSDDAWVVENSLDECVELLLAMNPEKDLIAIRYSEGKGHSGKCPPDEYWSTNYHADFRSLPGIDKNYVICGVLMVGSRYYKKLGGVDPGYVHLNMNVHDFCIRAQRNGSNIRLSPSLVMNCDWEPERTAENSPLIKAFVENDLPVFRKMYAENTYRAIHINPEGWRDTSAVWSK